MILNSSGLLSTVTESSQWVEHKNRMSRISEWTFYTCLENWIDWFIEKIWKRLLTLTPSKM